MEQLAQQPGDPDSGPVLPGQRDAYCPDSSTFANLLAALARAEEKPLQSWSDRDLADDVATLSYERALQAQARCRPRELDDRSLTQPSAAHCNQGKVAAPVVANPSDEATSTKPHLKSASVTVRMSQGECEQLRGRAAEAGLTVSAYLRSCALEVETLRAQVKEALAQLRSAPPSEAAAALRPARSSWLRRVLGR
jgi:hypothetical protein